MVELILKKEFIMTLSVKHETAASAVSLNITTNTARHWNTRTVCKEGQKFLETQARQLDTYLQIFETAEMNSRTQEIEAAKTLNDFASKTLVELQRLDRIAKRAYAKAVKRNPESMKVNQLTQILDHSTKVITFFESTKDLSSHSMSILSHCSSTPYILIFNGIVGTSINFMPNQYKVLLGIAGIAANVFFGYFWLNSYAKLESKLNVSDARNNLFGIHIRQTLDLAKRVCNDYKQKCHGLEVTEAQLPSA